MIVGRSEVVVVLFYDARSLSLDFVSSLRVVRRVVGANIDFVEGVWCDQGVGAGFRRGW